MHTNMFQISLNMNNPAVRFWADVYAFACKK